MLRFLCLIPKILRNDPFMHTYIATITWEHSIKPTQCFCKWMTGRHADADRVFLQFDNEQDRKFTNTAEKQNRYFLSLCRRANVSDMIFLFACTVADVSLVPAETAAFIHPIDYCSLSPSKRYRIPHLQSKHNHAVCV